MTEADTCRKFVVPLLLKASTEHGAIMAANVLNSLPMRFGGADQLSSAVSQLQSLLYAA